MMKMGGFVGKVEYRDDISGFVALPKLGEKVHVGKATGFGLGKYESKMTLQKGAMLPEWNR